MNLFFKGTALVLAVAMSWTSPVQAFHDNHSVELRNQSEMRSEEDLIILVAAAMHVWNPQIETRSIEGVLREHVKAVGVEVALLTPLVAMVDMSYICKRPQFAQVLGPLIQHLSPSVASEMARSVRLPSRYSHSISEISRYPIRDLESAFGSSLGRWTSQKLHNDSPIQESPARIIDQVLVGPGSLLSFVRGGGRVEDAGTRGQSFFGNLGGSSEIVDSNPDEDTRGLGRAPYDSKRGGVNSTPGNYRDPVESEKGETGPRRGVESEPNRGRASFSDDDRGDRQRGPFSNRDLVSYNTCIATCADSAGKLGFLLGGAGFKIGTYLSPTVGPLGPVTGAAVGGAIGVALGGYDCSKSAPCQPKKDKDEVPPKTLNDPKEPKQPKEPKEPKEPNEPKVPKDPKEPKDPEVPSAPQDPSEAPPKPKTDDDGATPKPEKPPTSGNDDGDDGTPEKNDQAEGYRKQFGASVKGEIDRPKGFDLDRSNPGVIPADPKKRDRVINPGLPRARN